MVEKRESPRHRTFKTGQINADKHPSVDCIIRNMSEDGACLEVKSALVPVDEFGLVIRPDSIYRHCKVTWRKPGQIGVSFFEPEER